MEMERINENTIRVSIKNSDLTERGITFLDLLGNQKQIENFFYSILEEVDVDEQFQETDSVTFQVLPNRDGLELFISKNVISDSDENNFDEVLVDSQVEDFADFISQQMAKNPTIPSDSEQSDKQGDLKTADLSKVFGLSSFEELIILAKHVELSGAKTSVYKYRDQLFMVVTFIMDKFSEQRLNLSVAHLYEFSYQTPMTKDVLEEHGQVVIEDQALETVRQYF